MTAMVGTEQSVRQYFTRLSLHGQSRKVLDGWPSLPVESFFMAMSLPVHFMNRGKKECGAAVQPLGSLFADVKWG